MMSSDGGVIASVITDGERKRVDCGCQRQLCLGAKSSPPASVQDERRYGRVLQADRLKTTDGIDWA